ncbi:hypothetical protein [Mycobacteroides salmoniphilum]|uniref:hypothetical protein n=1 Tax=Mycobacteroides salmoniphilum TaxID=404941 RepID=UPI003B8A9824
MSAIRAAQRAGCRLVMLGDEDFEIVPVAAMGCRTTVLALGAGGVPDTVSAFRFRIADTVPGAVRA